MERQIVPATKCDLTLPGTITGGLDLAKRKEAMDERFEPMLPFLYLSNNRTEGVAPWKLCKWEDGETEEIEAPYILCHILSRKMVRRLEGGQYKERAFAPILQDEKGQMIGETVGKFEEVAKLLESIDEGAQVSSGGWSYAISHLVVLVQGERCTFATLEAGGSLEDYFTELLLSASLKENQGGKVTISSHEKNLKTSKKGFEYLASWKFKQWEQVDLSQGQVERIYRKHDEQKKLIENYLKK